MSSIVPPNDPCQHPPAFNAARRDTEAANTSTPQSSSATLVDKAEKQVSYDPPVVVTILVKLFDGGGDVTRAIHGTHETGPGC